jgi:hypothetical protein
MLIAQNVAMGGISIPGECLAGVGTNCTKWLLTTTNPADAQNFGPYSTCWTGDAKAASDCESQCSDNISLGNCKPTGTGCSQQSECCSGVCYCMQSQCTATQMTCG